jgi:hypothetical protein
MRGGSVSAEYFSVDRRGYYKPGGTLNLFKENPFGWTSFLPIDGLVTAEALAAHLNELFPDGLSLHGWNYMTGHTDFLTKHGTTVNYANYETTLELLLEYVRRAEFPSSHSRMQSYFAFGSLDAALAFRTNGSPVYRLDADVVLQLDQHWLRHGNQGVAGSYCARKYWSGAGSDNPKWECLLMPPVRVLRQVG